MKHTHTYDSDEEYYFACWLNELKSEGLVIDYETQIKFELIDKKQVVNGKKKRQLCREWTYTADFKITWSQRVLDLGILVSTPLSSNLNNEFFNNDNPLISYVDIKASYTSKYKVTDITFPLVQKFMLEEKGIFINKIKPLCKTKGLFKTTYTPKAYTITKTGKSRKESWQHKTLQQYLNEITK